MNNTKVKIDFSIGIIFPCGKVPHECNFYRTKKANSKAFYKYFTMRNDVKIAAFLCVQKTVLN